MTEMEAMESDEFEIDYLIWEAEGLGLGASGLAGMGCESSEIEILAGWVSDSKIT